MGVYEQPDPRTSKPVDHEITPSTNTTNTNHQHQPKTHVYISLTGIGPVDGTTGPFDTAAAAVTACLGHWAVQSRGWRCGPRTAVPPLALPHSGWKLTPQPACEQVMSPPDFLLLQKWH